MPSYRFHRPTIHFGLVADGAYAGKRTGKTVHVVVSFIDKRVGGAQMAQIPQTRSKRVLSVVEKVVIGTIWAAVPVVIVLIIILDPKVVPLNTDAARDIGQTLLLLMFIALIVERALEAIISAWRGPGKQRLKPTTAEESPSPEYLSYTHATRIIVLALALLLGLLIAAVGIRVIEPIVDSTALEKLGNQDRWFRSIDVLLTGGVIAGGSEGIHKIAKVFDRLMDRGASGPTATGS